MKRKPDEPPECDLYGDGCPDNTNVHPDGEMHPLPRPRRGRPYGVLLPEVHGQCSIWVEHARTEHASVAAFARHTLELLLVGAPGALIEAATRAQADEVRHAALCLDLARRLGARAALAAMPTDAPLRAGRFAVLHGVAEEGCVEEARSVWSMIDELERTADPRIRAVLTVLIRDEIQHAELAWRTLAWGLPQLEAAERDQVLAVLRRPSGQRDFDNVVRVAAASLAA